jgi:hypothetical protein
VAYWLLFDETTVQPYLRGMDLSREGRVILATAFTRELRDHGDAYRGDPRRRLFPGSDYFSIELVFRDPVHRVIHRLKLVVSDAAAEYGILRVVYAEDEFVRSS